MFKLCVNKSRIEVTEVETITSGSKNSIEVQFCFSDEWAGLKKTAFFRAGSSSKEVTASVLLKNSVPTVCTIPSEVLVTPNRYLYCGVRGKKGEDTIIPTVWVKLAEILEGTNGFDDEEGGLTPDQLLDYIQQKQDKLTGKPGQFVGFNSEGEAEAQNWPEDGGSSGETPILPENVVTTDDFDTYKAEQAEALNDKISTTGGIVTGPLLFVDETSAVAEGDEEVTGPTTGTEYGSQGVYKDAEGPLYIRSLSRHVSFGEDENPALLSGVQGDEETPDSVPNFGQLKSAVSDAVDNVKADIPKKVTDLSDADNYATKTYVNDEIGKASIGGEGVPGPVGPSGENGKSAYEIAVENGFTGTVEQWLESLKGEPGVPGKDGENGKDGAPGKDGEPGQQGLQGIQGEQGVQGDQGIPGVKGDQGPKGDPGEPFSVAKVYPSVAAMNADFSSTDVEEGQFVLINTGDVEDEDNAKLYVKGATAYSYITDLSGAQGMRGPKGEQGEQGEPGEQGPQGVQGIQGIQGEQGQAGQPGADGFSPTVSIAPNGMDDGTLVTITDVNGTRSFEVLNGEDGEPGTPGTPGANATINGENAIQLQAGENVEITQENGVVTISATGATPSTQQLVNAPIGVIMAWYDTAETVPQGWHVCDGTEGTLDLRDVFLLGAGENHSVGEIGGAEEVKLTVEQMPSHSHYISVTNSIPTASYTQASVSPGGIGSSANQQPPIQYTGNSKPHPNMPPYRTVLFIQKIGPTPTDYVTEARAQEIVQEATIPTRELTAEEYEALSDEEKNAKVVYLVPGEGGGNSGGNSTETPSGVPSGFIGMWSGETVPDGWALCDGTNGTPDLRGRFVLGSSEAHVLGETGGNEEVTLTVDQMPAHVHGFNTKSSTARGTVAYYTTNELAHGSGKQYDTYQWISEAGGSQPHPNMPPYYVLAYIMKL